VVDRRSVLSRKSFQALTSEVRPIGQDRKIVVDRRHLAGISDLEAASSSANANMAAHLAFTREIFLAKKECM
jgi:hypothetical protein